MKTSVFQQRRSFTTRLIDYQNTKLDWVNSNVLDTFRQKGVDTLLSIDMVNLAASGKISDAVLVAGDSDYIPAIRVVKDHGVNVTLFHSKDKNSYHRALWDICDERYPIDLGLIEKIKRKSNIS